MRLTMNMAPLAATLAVALAATSAGAQAPAPPAASPSPGSQVSAPPTAAPAAAPTPAPSSPTPSEPAAPATTAGPTLAPPAPTTAAAPSAPAPNTAAAPSGATPNSSPESTKPGLRRRAHKAAPVAPPAAAPAPADTLAPSPFSLPAVTLPRVDLWVGVRDELIKDRSYDPYSTDDQLPMFQARAGFGLGALGAPGLAAIASLALGDSSASDRGTATELHVLRLGLGPELRIPVFDRLYLLGRLQPEAVHVSTRLHDDIGSAQLTDSGWSFGLDAALGAAFRLADIPTGESSPGLGIFVRVEGGYSWTASHEVRLAASGDGAPLRSAPLGLGDLALRGASFGAALGIGY